MPKTIEPLNPDDIRNPESQTAQYSVISKPVPEQPVSSQSVANANQVPPASPPTPPIFTKQPGYLDANERKKKRYRKINLAILFFILLILAAASWHFWVTPNKKSGKTILGTTDKTTLAGLNKNHATGTLNGYSYPDYKQPIAIPSARQTYSIENGGYKYTFLYLKGSEKPKYTDTDLQDVSTPAGPYSLDLWIKPSDKQKQLACDKYSFVVRSVNIFGQNYPLCGRRQDNTDKLAGAYYLHFFYLGKWHDFQLYNLADSSYFTDQLAVDVLNSLKIEKL
jgi:hypothetical protein